MICGIGVDTTDIKTVEEYLAHESHAFEKRTFTEREREAARKSGSYGEYLAVRFAIKEAVFKAVAHLTKEKTFDFRKVEALSYEDGAPYIVVEGILKEILEETGISNLLVSATTENHYATAFVIAEKE